MATKPDLTFYFLNASRAIRIAWLLEELDLPYKLISSPRAPNGLAPPEFKKQMGTKIGKSPTIVDHGIVIQESGAITEYLCETYDQSSHRLIPTERAARAKVREWIAASEGTFMIHGLAVLYARWRMPEAGKKDLLPEMERGLSVNVQADLDWLESELQAGNGKFLVGDHVTAADTMMGFSVRFILTRKLGTGEREWPAVEGWLRSIEGREGYRRAVEKTGHSL